MKRLTIHAQWESCSAWYEKLSSNAAADYPVLDSLNESWEQLELLYEYPAGKPMFERGEKLRSTASTPLSALFFFIDMGFYPPPELLLTLLDTWEYYRASNGEVSLEEAFLGPPVPKAGNHARRKNAQLIAMLKALDMTRLLNEGKTKTEAAEVLAERFGGTPETIMRTVKPIGNVRKPEK